MRIQERVSRVENKVDVLATKVDALASKVDDFIEEMRQKDNQRAAENQALRAEMAEREKAIRAEMAAKDNQRAAEIKESRAEMATIGRHVRNITIAAMVGIGALALSGGAIAGAVIYSVLTR